MTEIGEKAVALLRFRRVRHTQGLTESEIEEIEAFWGFVFADDHRYLLTRMVPVGEHWIDWRADPREEIADRLAWPLDGMLFDVAHHAFWPSEWGERPTHPDEAQAIARREFESWTTLVPIFSHRYMPSAALEGAPVFSVYQTDVIVYGANLYAYLSHEIAGIEAVEQDPPSGFEPWLRIVDGWGREQPKFP